MRAVGAVLTVAVLVMCMTAACGAAWADDALILPQPADDWQDGYLTFLEGSFDVFSALWPDGVSGMGFIDLDLDGTPELVVFDQGASVNMGAHLFDLANGWVWCVSSGLDSAAGAFSPDYLHSMNICASFFESFRLSRTADGWRFWVDSTDGALGTAWDEFVRFENQNGILAPVSVCRQYLESDPETGAVVRQEYTAAGQSADQSLFYQRADGLLNAPDAGYEAKGAFRWSGYDTTTREGFMALAQAAVDAYVPITDVVPQAVLAP